MIHQGEQTTHHIYQGQDQRQDQGQGKGQGQDTYFQSNHITKVTKVTNVTYTKDTDTKDTNTKDTKERSLSFIPKGKVYGYLRVSTKHQDISRQRVNILKEYPQAILYEETHSGGDYNGCIVLDKLLRIVESGDTIVFDSVSRFSRDNITGPLEYKKLFKAGVRLVFLNEPYINTDNYKKALDIAIPRTGTFVDPILKGIEDALIQLAEKQVQEVFEQSHKELIDIRSRTRQALQKKIADNKILPEEERIRIGTQKGDTFTTKKKQLAIGRIKEGIEKGYSDEVIMNNISGDIRKHLPNSKYKDISRNTYYNYKREVLGREKREYVYRNKTKS